MTTVGSLCTGYGGLDDAARQVTGGSLSWVCEYEAAPSTLLALRFPGVPNFGDLKALEWADYPVDVLTAGFPCQPFSGAGKRLGTDDPRHLFPWIARGVERMRPPLLLLENVRGHLTLGFDVVLAELDRIGYDARWTLLRAADVGAPHGRARLWIAARDRHAGGWPAPASLPTALLENGEWTDPASGLFGSIPAQRPGTAGVMVDGVRYDSDSSLRDLPHLLPTPEAKLGSSGPDYARIGRDASGGDDLTTTVHRHLLPTPTSAAGLGGNLSRSGDRGDELLLPGLAKAHAEGSLLPTPRATDGTKGGPNQRGSSGDLMLPSAVQHLLPTPACNDMGAGKTPEQWDAWTDKLKASHGNGNGHGPSLSIEAARLAQNRVSEPSDQGERADDGTHEGLREAAAGQGLPGLRGDFQPQAVQRDARGPEAVRVPHDLLAVLREQQDGGDEGRAALASPEAPQAGVRDVRDDEGAARPSRRPAAREQRPVEPADALRVLPPTTPLAGGPRLADAGDGAGRRDGHAAWGPYAAAILRWEVLLGRVAPPPTEPGRTGPRLSPKFVEFLMGLPAGWVTDVPGLTRNQQFTMLGNGVVPTCAAAAFTLLGVADLYADVAA